jgi:molecular chaperone DnaJ
MNLYVLLGVPREATLNEIKRAYRRLARKYHPDINPGDREAAELFRLISSAYATLSDPAQRSLYDVHGEQRAAGDPSTFAFQGFDFSIASETAHPSTFGELFGDAVRTRGGALAGGVPDEGADLHATLAIDFEDAIRGGRSALTVSRLERCAPCAGFGRLNAPERRCIRCDGVGHVRTSRGHMVFVRTCEACAGTGLVRHRTCAACGGEGVGLHPATVMLDLPAGIQDGTTLVCPREGHAGRRGGAPGALHVTVTVRPHSFFRRSGDDICIEVPVAIHEAALGARIDVPAIDGTIRLRVPPATPSGQTFRFRERGARGATGRRGDFLVTIRLALPRVLDERSRELLREFAARNPESVRDTWTTTGTARATEPLPDAATRPAPE